MRGGAPHAKLRARLRPASRREQHFYRSIGKLRGGDVLEVGGEEPPGFLRARSTMLLKGRGVSWRITIFITMTNQPGVRATKNITPAECFDTKATTEVTAP